MVPAVENSVAEGNGLIAEASDKEGVGGRADWVVARAYRLGCK